jgi:hypothetical protein
MLKHWKADIFGLDFCGCGVVTGIELDADATQFDRLTLLD